MITKEEILEEVKKSPESDEEIISLVSKNYNEYISEFKGWFQSILRKTETCNLRDVYRFSKGSLRISYLIMCARQDSK